MKKMCALFVAIGLDLGLGSVVLQRFRAEAAAGGEVLLPPCQDINADGSSSVTDAVFLLNWLFRGGPEPMCPKDDGQPSGLPDTGQAFCYIYNRNLQTWVYVSPCERVPCPGQDGAHATGCPSESRFLDNGDGTVTDTCTGLMWQQDTADTNGDGQPTDQDFLGWCEAITYCENLSLAGHDDWRLPNVRELLSIVDYGRPDLMIDPVFGVTPNGWGSPYVSSTRLGWFVRFSDGTVFQDGERIFFVRAVRDGPGGSTIRACQDINGDRSSDISDAIHFLEWLFLGGPAPSCPPGNGRPAGLPDTGQTTCSGPGPPCPCPGEDSTYQTGCPPEGRFADNGDGTVTDNCTGLMWQQDTADTNGDGQPTDQDFLVWCDALTYCENLSFAGHDDWRLPNIRELQSLVDYGRSDSKIDPVFGLIPVQAVVFQAYWSSTWYYIGARAWQVHFGTGASGGGSIGDLRYVRAVRSVRR